MIYSDLLFLMGILPVSVLASFFDKSTEYKNLILVLTSFAFFSWGKPFAVCLIFLTSIVEWGIGLKTEKLRTMGKNPVLLVLADAVMNLTVLWVMTRYFLFLREDAFGFSRYIIPVFIGFYLIRGFAYVYDVYKGNIRAEKNVFCLITYMCAYFFNVTGLTVKYGEIEPQIRHREFTVYKMNEGLNYLVFGLGKSVILGAALKTVGESYFGSEQHTCVGYWIGIITMVGFAYFMYIGFSDISYGLARIYGFNIKKSYEDLSARGMLKGVFKNVNTGVARLFAEVYNTLFGKAKTIKWACLPIFVGCITFLCRQSVTSFVVGVGFGIAVLMEINVLDVFYNKAPWLVRLIVTYLPAVVLTGYFVVEDYKTVFAGMIGIDTVGYVTKFDVKVLLNNIFVIAVASVMMIMPLKRRVKDRINDYSAMSIEKYGKIGILKTLFTALVFAVCIILIASANVKP